MLKNLEIQPKQLDSLFSGLENSIKAIFNKQSSKISYDELYHNVYLLVVNRYCEKTYDCINIFLEKNIKKKCEEFCVKENDLIRSILEIWREIKEMLKLINSICLFLQKKYIIPNSLQSLNSKGKNHFLNYLLNPQKNLYQEMTKIILENFKKQRNLEIVDKINLTGITNMIVI